MLDTGDIAWVDFNPVKGTEQSGRRPAMVLTSADYHRRSGRAVVCPISSSGEGWTFNVALPSGMKTRGYVLVDQVRTIERGARLFEVTERASEDVLADVRGVLAALLGFESILPIIATDS
jgi:mRNA interferase MazF